MSYILEQIRKLIDAGDLRISEHGYDQIAADGLFSQDIIKGVSNAILIEEYPNYYKGPCVLVLQYDSENKPVHVVWGIPAGHAKPAVLVTAYRPDPAKWTMDFRRRRT